MQRKNKAVFLDKDGTLITDIPYNVDPDKIMLSDNCITGLKRLQQNGYLLILATNQAGVALGYFKEECLKMVEQKIAALLNEQGIRLERFYYCPHHPDGTSSSLSINCNCRKPRPGLLLKAAKEMNIDLRASWMIGDILNDVEAGNSAGCKSILIDNGNETEWAMNMARMPLAKAKTINEAADFILDTDDKQLAGM